LNCKAVINFATKTGDLRALSKPDLQILALTYMLEKEENGIAHIPTQPLKTATADGKSVNFGKTKPCLRPGAVTDTPFGTGTVEKYRNQTRTYKIKLSWANEAWMHRDELERWLDEKDRRENPERYAEESEEEEAPEEEQAPVRAPTNPWGKPAAAAADGEKSTGWDKSKVTVEPVKMKGDVKLWPSLADSGYDEEFKPAPLMAAWPKARGGEIQTAEEEEAAYRKAKAEDEAAAANEAAVAVDADGMLRITVKHTIVTSRPGESITTTREETHEVEVEADHTVLQLKELLAPLTKVPAAAQRLKFKGVLEDNVPLRRTAVRSGCKVVMNGQPVLEEPEAPEKAKTGGPVVCGFVADLQEQVHLVSKEIGEERAAAKAARDQKDAVRAEERAAAAALLPQVEDEFEEAWDSGKSRILSKGAQYGVSSEWVEEGEDEEGWINSDNMASYGGTGAWQTVKNEWTEELPSASPGAAAPPPLGPSFFESAPTPEQLAADAAAVAEAEAEADDVAPAAAEVAVAGPPRPEAKGVCCITTDFAMQNVLLQMHLRLLSADGMLIKRLKQWQLKCRACFTVIGDMTRLFCPKCGSDTINRVSVTVDKFGRVKVHAKKQESHNLQGTVFSIPTAGRTDRAGAKSLLKTRFSGGMLLREDQMMMGCMAQQLKKKKELVSHFGESPNPDPRQPLR
jgi:rRNA maturation endonuclease Nob1